MKVLISDYSNVLLKNASYEKEIIEAAHPDWQVELYEYKNDSELIERLQGCDALLTAFLDIGDSILKACPDLKCISVNATGYNSIDVGAASKAGVAVAAIDEYCTDEVAEHTITLMMALARGIKHYIKDVDENKNWSYYSGPVLRRIKGLRLGIFGFGRIGRKVAAIAKALGMEVLAYDKYINVSDLDKDVKAADPETIYESCDVITNHMAQTDENRYFFDWSAFCQMKRKPFFINAGRGKAVCEADLVRALDEGIISGAGLDVLESDEPDLTSSQLTGRENVIITPHAAFYSKESIDDLRRISSENIISFLDGKYDNVNKFINRDELKGGRESDK